VEADLQAVYGIDYRDRWRHDDTGRVRLTLRRLAVLMRHLPAESAVGRTLHPEPQWTRQEVLTAHVWQAAAQSKKPHPMLAAAERGRRRASPSPDRQKRLRAAVRRARERRRLIEDGSIT
jgi:hypothetical protein